VIAGGVTRETAVTRQIRSDFLTNHNEGLGFDSVAD
jgi:hypothetical protein